MSYHLSCSFLQLLLESLCLLCCHSLLRANYSSKKQEEETQDGERDARHPLDLVMPSNQTKLRSLLLLSDSSIKQYLLHLDKEHHFVIRDLDETHLLVDSTVMGFLQQKLDELQDENTYVPIKN